MKKKKEGVEDIVIDILIEKATKIKVAEKEEKMFWVLVAVWFIGFFALFFTLPYELGFWWGLILIIWFTCGATFLFGFAESLSNRICSQHAIERHIELLQRDRLKKYSRNKEYVKEWVDFNRLSKR